MNETEIADALSHLPADDRDIWVRAAFAVKDALGERGYDIWDAWSQGSERYQAPAARATWRSARDGGGITAGWLFHTAKEYGWRGDVTAPRLTLAEIRARALVREAEAAQRRTEAERAAQRAAALVEEAEVKSHPYLARKGFAEAQGLVVRRGEKELLVLPMRDHENGKLTTAQIIHPDGTKRFLPGGRARGAVLRLPLSRTPTHHAERWYVEGYATGLSVFLVLGRWLYQRKAEVVVTFSASNLSHVAKSEGGRYVLADRDWWRCTECRHRWDTHVAVSECPSCGSDSLLEPAGQKYARESGLEVWLPPRIGDANDLMQEEGPAGLARRLRDFQGQQRRKRRGGV